MSVTRDDVITRLPEFEDIEAGPYFNSVIASAELEVSQKRWTKFRNDGVILLTGHMLQLGRRKGSAGQVKSEKVGDLRREFATSAGSGSLMSTTHGAEYQRLMRILPTRPLVC